jgi:hypothetical protein
VSPGAKRESAALDKGRATVNKRSAVIVYTEEHVGKRCGREPGALASAKPVVLERTYAACFRFPQKTPT